MNYASKLAIIFTEKCFYFFTQEDLVQAGFELRLCRLWGRYFSASFRNSRLSWRMRASWVSTEAQSMGRAMMLP